MLNVDHSPPKYKSSSHATQLCTRCKMRREVSTEEEASRYPSQTPAEMQAQMAPGGKCIFSRLDIGGTFLGGWSPSQPESQLIPPPLPIVR